MALYLATSCCTMCQICGGTQVESSLPREPLPHKHMSKVGEYHIEP